MSEPLELRAPLKIFQTINWEQGSFAMVYAKLLFLKQEKNSNK